jgi:hypothetical protein
MNFTGIASDGAAFELVVRLALGALASFLAIIVWSKTRDLAWICVIAGILASYAGTLYRALRLFGLFSGPEILVYGASLGSLVSDNLSVVFFILAFIVFLRSRHSV